MSRSGTYRPLDRLPLDSTLTPAMPAAPFFGLIRPPLTLMLASFGWPGRTAAPQPQYSRMVNSTSGTAPASGVDLSCRAGSGGSRVSDLPRFSPAGTWSCASTPGFSALCRAMSRYWPVMPAARVEG